MEKKGVEDVHPQQVGQPSFCIFISKHTLQSKKLMVPAKFVDKHGDVFSKEATLILPNDNIWKVGATKLEHEIWLERKWDEFVEHFSLLEWHFLTFILKCKSTFEVRIFDRTACEILYPTPITANANGNGSSSQTSTKCNKGYYMGFRVADKERKRMIHSSKNFNTKFPHFSVLLRKYHLQYHIVTVPLRFAKQYMGVVAEEVKVIVEGGREWSVKVNRKQQGNLNLGRGWLKFHSENNLKAGDSCIFELVDKNIFKVTMHRA
ncbi:B3 domain-containing transcription factor VRN1-like [Mercurialis annua]|uniref:B3 domain-containing transcription factor VRN1-like n=1 Tax=Mercurialis annua TaxID=3986 RepID=UPI00215E6F8F|nr:B3 domain-containing transcription factor VRN1-like [Mercurialis annua]